MTEPTDWGVPFVWGRGMAKLPWFKFYVQDWLTDPRVLGLTNEQRGIFHWLLCRQWLDGDLPGDLMHIYPLLPPGSDSAAVAYVISTFFPGDPDTTRRANPRLQREQEEQEAKYAAKIRGAATARAAKGRKLLPATTSVDANADSKGRSKNQNQTKEKEGPMALKDALQVFKDGLRG